MVSALTIYLPLQIYNILFVVQIKIVSYICCVTLRVTVVLDLKRKIKTIRLTTDWIKIVSHNKYADMLNPLSDVRRSWGFSF